MKDKELNEKLEYYLSLNYSMKVQENTEEGMYFVEFPDLPGSMAHGATPDAAIELAKEIKKDWIETALSLGRTVPEPKREEDFSGRITLRLSPSEHKYLTEQAEAEGRSLNQYLSVLCLDRSRARDLNHSLRRLDKVAEDLKKVAEKHEKTKSAVETVFILHQEAGEVKELEPVNDVKLAIEGGFWIAGTNSIAPNERH